MKEKEPSEWVGKKKCLQMEIQGIHLQNMQTVQVAQLKKKMEKWAKDGNGRFSIEGTQVDIKYAKRCSVSLIIREMQIKSSMRCHFTPVSMAISKIRQQ